MKKINLETCDRNVLKDLGIKYEDHEIYRMSASNLRENWTERHAKLDKTTLPNGSVVLKSGAFYGSGCVAVKDGRVVDRAFRGACPWWDDDIHSVLCIPEAGETLHQFGVDMNSFSFCYDDDDMGLPRGPGDWGWGTPLCWNGNLFRSGWLRSIGADKDAEEVEALEAAAERAARKARYEAARDRAELLYPYEGAKVFRARIQWALEDGVAEAAKALAPHVKFLHLRPLGGWKCHYRRLPGAWRRAYGWGEASDSELDTLMGVCQKLTQPRLEAAWDVACVLANG